MTTCKEEALRWVHRYAAGGAAFAAIPMPFSTSTGLAAIETHMSAMIAEIYSDPQGSFAAATVGGAFAALGQGLKFVACQATCFVPVLGIPIRMAIAGGTIESLGHAIVAHYERKHPGKVFTKPTTPPAT
ncbi:MAG: hypothetical protein QM820_30065 [Minicystis sp.]